VRWLNGGGKRVGQQAGQGRPFMKGMDFAIATIAGRKYIKGMPKLFPILKEY